MASRPARTLADGVDLSQRIRSAAALRAAGRTFAVRYVSPNTTSHPEKRLTAAERDDCLAHGVSLAVVWETTATRATAGRSAGAIDAAAAAAVVRSLGLDPMPIHWAIDFDASGPQVEAYARGWVDAIGIARCGAYGGIRPLAYLLDRGLITYAWQAYAWSSGLIEPRATAYQWQNDVAVAGNNCDLDAALAHDFGQWPRPTNPGDQGVDMTTVDLTPAAVAAIWAYKPPGAGGVDETAIGILSDVRTAILPGGSVAAPLSTLLGDETAAAAALAALKTELDGLPAALVAAIGAMPGAQPGNTLTIGEVQSAAETAVADVLKRTTAVLDVAAPPAGVAG